jgi:hypothetical protein
VRQAGPDPRGTGRGAFGLLIWLEIEDLDQVFITFKNVTDAHHPVSGSVVGMKVSAQEAPISVFAAHEKHRPLCVKHVDADVRFLVRVDILEIIHSGLRWQAGSRLEEGKRASVTGRS